MPQRVVQAVLEKDNVVDISTTGRRTGKIHRFEIWFHYVDEQVYLTGKPTLRDWYANMVAHPQITFHLKQSVRVDLPATAKPIIDEQERCSFLSKLKLDTDYWDDLAVWLAGSPLVRIELISSD